ncbi:hypothetical protein JXJ21_01865 [candidate division KSB1 bacterium]|nr:hypothetical protein [candidate division KSB1 bacterium]
MMHALSVAFLFLAIFFCAAISAEPTTIALPAKGPYFPCDDRIIEDRWQVERFVVPLTRDPHNPLIVKDHPWEGTGPHAGGSVIYDPDDGLFKMWYSVWNEYAYYNRLRFSYNVCYAESKDGINWQKPETGCFTYKGDSRNNCIRLGRNKTQNIDVELNPHPASPREKFIAIHNDSGGVFVSTSADGKCFDCGFEQPAVKYHSDTHNNFVYDEVRDRWLMYVRPKAYAGARLKGVGRRRSAVKESHDLKQWTPEVTVLVPGEDDPDYFYGNTVFRCGDLFFGMLQHYETVHHRLYCELIWSADGYYWQRLPTRAQKFALPDAAEGSWDWGMTFFFDKPVLKGKEMLFYYGGSNTAHNESGTYAIGLVKTPLNRLIGVRSKSGEQSRILTRPIRIDGDLWINAKACGEIRVQLTTIEDEPIDGWQAEDCAPFSGDDLEYRVRWGDRGLDAMRGQTVRIRFCLEDAELYAFDIH